MSKIKSIQISDFRIYNGTQEFSFDNAGQISNLMIIYAPNGFGKTSFFDAVEWCYASTIRRFESEVLGQEIARRDYSSGDKILLTNRKSFKNGKSGNVTILTSDDKVIKRDATERKANNMDFKYDYRTISTLSSDFSDQVLTRLVKTNILTQDQIDEFLRYTKADERFFQLQSFWPEGESAVLILQKIDSYLNMLSKEKQDIKTSITEAQQKIKEYLNADEQIVSLNASIDELIAKSATGFKLEPLTTNVNAQTYRSILDTTQTFIERAKLSLKNVDREISDLNRLTEEFLNFRKAVELKPILEVELNKLAALTKHFTDLKAFIASKKNAENSVAVLNDVKQKLRRLIDLIQPVSELYKYISAQRKIAEGHRANINTYLANIREFQNSRTRLESTLKDWDKEDENLLRSLVAWDTELREYKYWTTEQQRGTKKLKESQILLNEKDAAVNNKINRRQSLHEIQATHNYHNLSDIDKQNISEQLKVRDQQTELITRNQETLRKIQDQIDTTLSLEETFDKILTWGEQYIASTDANHCPLCATEFQDVNTLLEKVEQQRSGRNNTKALKEQLDVTKAEVHGCLNQLEVTNRAIEDHIKSLTETCDTEISTLQMQRNLLASEIADNQRVLENATRSASLHLSNLQLEFTSTANEIQIDFDQIKKAKEARLTELRLRLGRLTNVILGKKELISASENKVSILRNQIAAAENNVDIARADRRIEDAENIMKELEISGDNFNQEALESRYAGLSAQQNELLQQIRQTQEDIDATQQQFTRYSLKVAEAELPGLRVAKQEELTDCQNVIRTYTDLFKPLSNNEEPTNDYLTEALRTRNEKLKLVANELSGLEDLFIRLQVIEKNVVKNALEKQLGELATQLVSTENAFSKVRAARHTAEQYINGEINKYFNQDIINQIYSRIEPHPDLNQIKINPKVTDKGPILDIKAISSEEELDPSLYLSAGQLNVLSLSIFLAKAFETRSDEIETIFMDDPIQNLSDINVLSFIDLIRTMITKYNRQIVISSHDEKFYKLMRNKMPSDAFNVRYYQIESFGKAKYVE